MKSVRDKRGVPEKIWKVILMMKTFSIKGNYFKEKTFPGLNEYIAALGTNPRKGGRMKAEYEMIACNAIRRGLNDGRPRNL